MFLRTITSRRVPPARQGFSLTELLVASSIAVVVMGAVATLFGVIGRALSDSQSTIDLSGRMRTVAWQLRQDLAGVTCELTPWAQPAANVGYFELLEGPRRDQDAAHNSPMIEADTDDILLFTTRASSGSFTGRYDTDSIESPYAEVAWFCKPAITLNGVQLYNLHRRQLIVATYVGKDPFLAGNNAVSGALPVFLQSYDLSLRAEGGLLLPNSLGDLTKRENRFLRNGLAFPYTFPGAMAAGATFDGTPREGEDLVLTNVIAFDVRVFDPTARAQSTATPSLLPGDPGYVVGSAAGAAGAYVDLNWGGVAPVAIGQAFPPSNQSPFQGGGVRVANASRSTQLTPTTYDTWSVHYEFNGEDDDGDGKIDEGTDGLDDNANDIPDDPPESETSPPYPVQLKAIEARIRCYDPNSKQVRQVTVRHTFDRF